MCTVGDILTYTNASLGGDEIFIGRQFKIIQIGETIFIVRDVQTGAIWYFFKWRFGEVNPQSRLKATIQRIEKRHLCLK